jgi:hypothetical protein
VEERKPLRELTNQEIYELVKDGQDGHKWSIGLYLEVLRRGPDILEHDPGLKADWDAYHDERNSLLKASLDAQVMPKLAESIRLISEPNLALLEKISKGIVPPSFSATLLQNLIPKIAIPKYDFSKLEVPRFDYPKLDYALRSEVVKENPSLENFPLESDEVIEATNNVLNKSSDIVGLLAQIVASSNLTAERVQAPKWQRPVAIWTLVLTACGLAATVLIAIFD